MGWGKEREVREGTEREEKVSRTKLVEGDRL
jgi:hypothetical protein